LKAQKGFNGFGEHKLSKLLEDMLTKEDKDWALKPDIKWNFTKFIIDRKGEVVARFEPTADMKKVAECVEKLI
jgi:glutathione peroxidase